MTIKFSVNEDRCARCGTCSQVCLSSIIVPDPDTGIPAVSPDNRQFCTACGHCESFCPEGAAGIDSPGAAPFPGHPLVREVSPETVRNLIASRRTIRHFQDHQVPRRILFDLLENTRYAPSGFNLHPVEWMVVEDRTVIRSLSSKTMEWIRSLDAGIESDEYAPLIPFIPKILDTWDTGADPVCYHAPALIVAHADRKVFSAGYDALIALSYLDLVAPAYGLGTCWAGLLQMALSGSPAVSGLLPFPPGHIAHHVLMIGKPRYSVYQIPKRIPAGVSFV